MHHSGYTLSDPRKQILVHVAAIINYFTYVFEHWAQIGGHQEKPVEGKLQCHLVSSLAHSQHPGHLSLTHSMLQSYKWSLLAFAIQILHRGYYNYPTGTSGASACRAPQHCNRPPGLERACAVTISSFESVHTYRQFSLLHVWHSVFKITFSLYQHGSWALAPSLAECWSFIMQNLNEPLQK